MPERMKRITHNIIVAITDPTLAALLFHSISHSLILSLFISFPYYYLLHIYEEEAHSVAAYE
jgi:hypothetical protein